MPHNWALEQVPQRGFEGFFVSLKDFKTWLDKSIIAWSYFGIEAALSRRLAQVTSHAPFHVILCDSH